MLDVTLSDGGWSRELRKSSPSCLLLSVPAIVGWLGGVGKKL
jgi:hypothetical protein